MANHQALNSEAHRNTRVITARGEKYGENVHFVPVIADEMRSLVLEYPVCMMKDRDTGQFGLYALLGFEAGENLFLEGDRWNAIYVPAHVRRQPFMVGFSGQPGEQKTAENTVVTVDVDHVRVQEEEGERLFDDEGKATPFLEHISGLLSGIVVGFEATKAFLDAMSEHDLIEPAQISVTFGGGEQKRFDGLYTINDEKLDKLEGEVIQSLHQRGYFQAAVLVVASMGQMQRLIKLKNARVAANG